jgi:hypothetical protein
MSNEQNKLDVSGRYPTVREARGAVRFRNQTSHWKAQRVADKSLTTKVDHEAVQKAFAQPSNNVKHIDPVKPRNQLKSEEEPTSRTMRWWWTVPFKGQPDAIDPASEKATLQMRILWHLNGNRCGSDGCELGCRTRKF